MGGGVTADKLRIYCGIYAQNLGLLLIIFSICYSVRS